MHDNHSNKDGGMGISELVQQLPQWIGAAAVSYTHLTLPTIRLV